jgi:hypothetical protein
MARQVLGGLTTLNLSTNLDPMFLELYNIFTSLSTGTLTTTGAIVSGTTIAAGTNLSFAGVLSGGSSSAIAADIAGAGRFKGWANVTPTVSCIQLGAPAGTTSNISLVASGALVDERIWDVVTSSGGYAIRSVNDASTTTATALQITRAGTVITAVITGGNTRPSLDNTYSCGVAGQRWSVVYAGTGAINTSDAREKTQVHQLTADELSAAKQIAREFGTYQFLAALEEKGDAARLHSGTTVQRVIQIMESFGLDAMRYAFICYDEWDADHDDQGNETSPAGNRYGFRPDELMMFVARGIAARQDELEARIAALEP